MRAQSLKPLEIFSLSLSSSDLIPEFFHAVVSFFFGGFIILYFIHTISSKFHLFPIPTFQKDAQIQTKSAMRNDAVHFIIAHLHIMHFRLVKEKNMVQILQTHQACSANMVLRRLQQQYQCTAIYAERATFYLK